MEETQGSLSMVQRFWEECWLFSWCGVVLSASYCSILCRGSPLLERSFCAASFDLYGALNAVSTRHFYFIAQNKCRICFGSKSIFRWQGIGEDCAGFAKLALCLAWNLSLRVMRSTSFGCSYKQGRTSCLDLEDSSIR